MSYKVFMNYYKMNVFKHLGINTLGELQEFVQWYNKYWKEKQIKQLKENTYDRVKTR